MKKYMTIEEYFKTQSQNTNNNQKKRFNHIMIILCLIIIIFSLYNIFNWYHDNSKIRQINREIDKNINIKNNNEQGELINPPNDKNSDYYYYTSFPFLEVNFATLLTKNSDTVGYIHINNTNINYPIVQTTDNDYYLEHSFDKKENDAGWIFLDYRSNLSDLGDNTIIYGHARMDRTLFGSLISTLSDDWQKNRDNYIIYLSTPKENMIFQIFSIYTTQKESYYITPNFTSNSKKQLWLDTMAERNIAPINTKVNINDKILTLSTCKNNQGGRIVVQAKLIKKQKNKS